MCSDAAFEDEVMEFRLSERYTFLEYKPVTGMRSCRSAPALIRAEVPCRKAARLHIKVATGVYIYMYVIWLISGILYVI